MNRSKWLWLANKCGPANREMPVLVEKFGSVEKIYEASYEEYIEMGISERLCEDLCDKSLSPIMPIVNYCQNAQVGILCYDDRKYPMSLRALKDPPAVLYYKGNLPDLNKTLCISMVGTRKMSEYGMRAAYKIAYEIASSGAVVVSGMALGIDGIASCAAISAGGKTVAVLGCGIDRVYPAEHANLCELIKKHGAIMTEFPPSTPPKGTNFPMRNRIISGLGQGTVVVDANKDSGAMITAKTAILQGKDIYAVPGNIDSETSSGTNMLIRDGAQAVLCGNDVIANYAFLYRDSLDIQRLRRSESRSELSPEVVRKMGVAMKVTSKQEKSTSELTPLELGASASVSSRSDNKKTDNKKTVSKIPKTTDEKSKRLDIGAAYAEERQPERNLGRADRGGDDSARIVNSLSEKQRKIFDEIPLDKAITVDYLTSAGFSMGEVMSTLTVLEIKGLISSLPGAIYIRR